MDEENGTPRRLVIAAVAAAVFALAVLMVDLTIKRDVLEQAGQARRTLDEFRAAVKEAGDGQGPQAGNDGDAGRAGDHSGDGVVSPAGKRPAAAAPAAAPRGKAGSRAGRPAGGTQGNG